MKAKTSIDCGNLIRGRRKALEMSGPELAQKLGVQPQTLRVWECGRQWPGPKQIRQLAAILGCDPLDFLP